MSKFRGRSPTVGKRILLTMVFLMIFTALCLWLIDRGITPAIQGIAETRAQQLARDAINEAVSKQLAEDLHFEDLVRIEKDNEGKIVYMGWNSALVNRTLRDTTFRVQHFLKRMEMNELPLEDTTLEPDLVSDDSNRDLGKEPATLVEIPLGMATNNTVLSNLGPNIPVQLRIIGDVQTQFKNDITEYGINSAHFQLWINFKVSLRVVIPFSTETITVTNDIPVDSAVIPGEVPNFYNGDGSGNSPSFSYPMDPLQ
ncbi:sporulation protein YunB [Halobacillus sp. Marseille-Q1614]|uniref:sporulation protein YunB n=1 Tax=Halobacillus sp. Marseille-Q1614 TaxID=2709134 RepID=UPI001570B460|nr:sporulation protein YunB [Halobacillus sp. Marseille-Q1614]